MFSITLQIRSKPMLINGSRMSHKSSILSFVGKIICSLGFQLSVLSYHFDSTCRRTTFILPFIVMRFNQISLWPQVSPQTSWATCPHQASVCGQQIPLINRTDLSYRLGSAINCGAGYTWSTSNSYGQCCATTQTDCAGFLSSCLNDKTAVATNGISFFITE